eukprot:TRINITY_DN3321_c3_g2_i1.p2 TRINITY_DN3321_c3_g2~~TRINITY_DN3321_c3_g2_i1.p2  ORF type:complete len:61 (+),score=11.83 TRINITY_DN3321_c3_g2_i1:165-347(+)
MCLSAEEVNEFTQGDMDIVLNNAANSRNMRQFISPELLLQCFIEHNETHLKKQMNLLASI